MEAKKKRTEREELPSFNDIFRIVDNTDSGTEAVDIPISELHTFEGHPFKVKDDSSMMELVESIKSQGVIIPALARPRKDGGYELIYGHRRKRASELAGLSTLPTFIKDIDDKDAIDIMVDSNIQRPELLISEKAYAYAMKYRQVSKQGCRTDLTNNSVGVKLMQEQEGESIRTIQRYISLTKLLTELLEYVDEKKLSFMAGVELSLLSRSEQEDLLEVIQEKRCFPNKKEAVKIKEYAVKGELTKAVIESILDRKEPAGKKIILKAEYLQKYFPENYSDKEKENIIFELLEEWKKTWENKEQETQVDGQIDIEGWDGGRCMPK